MNDDNNSLERRESMLYINLHRVLSFYAIGKPAKGNK